MSEQTRFDRRKGFVALPVEVLEIDLSPGAFRTLAELCRMANAEGFCWPSLEQLSDRLGRSKSAISGYIKELRAADLVHTQEQKTANGYNYRLKYEVTFWRAWRAALSAATERPTKRRVQQDARVLETKKHNHKNQATREQDSNFDSLLRRWTRCFKGAPYPLASHSPSTDLLQETRQALSDGPRQRPADVDQIDAGLAALWQRLGLQADAATGHAHAKHLRKLDLSADELAQILLALERAWPAHWRRMPCPDSFSKLVTKTGVTSAARRRSLLEGFYKRWQKAENSLRKPTTSCSVAA